MNKKVRLSQCLKLEWKNYETQIRLTNKSASAEHVHQLRVSTQRLGGAIAVAQCLVPKFKSRAIEKSLRKVRRSFGKLRDLQVENEMVLDVKAKPTEQPAVRLLQNYLKRRQLKQNKKSRLRFSKAELSSQRTQVGTLIRDLEKIEQSTKREKLKSKSEDSLLLRLHTNLKALEPIGEHNQHPLRLLVKQARYQGEVLFNAFGTSPIDLAVFKRAQASLGKSHDHATMLKSINHFVRQNHGKIRHQLQDLEGLSWSP